MWTRPLTNVEKQYFDYYVDNKEILVADSFTINSSSSIDEDTFRKALEHLRRKTPNLRLAVRKRNDIPWFYKVDVDVDLKVLHDGNSKAEYKNILHTKHNLETGPAWSVIIVPDTLSIPSSDFNIRKDYPFQYCINFEITHIVTDGHSSTFIYGVFIKILDDVINGTPIDDQQQIGFHLVGTELHEEYIEAAAYLRSQVDQGDKSLRQCFVSDQATPLLAKYYPSKEPYDGTTAFSVDSLSVQETQDFIKLCKKHNVTVNSGMTAVLDLVIHETTKSKGALKSEHILNSQMVNLRRYLGTCSLEPLGIHTGVLFNGYDISNLDDLSEFWLHAKKVNKVCHCKLDSKESVNGVAIFYMGLDEETAKKEFDTLFKNDFVTSSLGNVDPYFAYETKHLKVTDLFRSSSIDSIVHRIFNYHTLNGRFIYSCCYQPSSSSKDFMDDLMTRIKVTFNRVLNTK